MTEADGFRRLPPAARFILQGGRPVREAAGKAFGLALPEDACRAHADAERAALWLGPDEHWLLAPAGQIQRLLDPEAFPVGMCARTLFAKAEVILWRRSAEEYHLEVARSFSDYVLEWMREVNRSDYP
jgi:sarcosine oxidase subunit gamma